MRVYNEETIDPAYEFALEIKSLFRKTSVHSSEELMGLTVLMVFIDYIHKTGLASVDWINWNDELPLGKLASETSTDLLNKDTLIGVIGQIEEQIPVLKEVFGELVNIKDDIIDERDIKKILLGIDTTKANWTNFTEPAVFTELIYELYADKTATGKIQVNAQQHDISQLMAMLLSGQETKQLYNPFSGLGEFLLNYKSDVHCTGVENDKTSYCLSKLLLFVNGTTNSKVVYGDVFSEANQEEVKGKFDAVICHPPFDLSAQKVIEHCLHALSDQGEAVILLPHDFLNSPKKEDRDFRKHLVEHNLIEWVFSLPTNRLPYTNIATTVLVLSKSERSHSPVMIDLSVDSRLSDVFWDGDLKKVTASADTDSPWLFEADMETLAKHHYNLVPNLYLLEQKRHHSLKVGYEFVKLGKLLKPIAVDKSYKHGGQIVGSNSLSKDYLYAIKDENTLITKHEWNADKPHYHHLATASLLLAKVGGQPKAAFYTGSAENIYYNSREVYAFRIDTDKVEAEYLLSELHKEDVKQQWACHLTGTGQRKIAKGDLLQIEIDVPKSRQQQKNDVQAHRDSLIKKTLEEKDSIVEILKERQRKNLAIKKHRISPHLLNATSFVKILSKQMKKSDGLLKEHDIIDTDKNVTIGSCLQRLNDSLQEIAFYIEHLTDETKYFPAEKLSIDTLLYKLTIEEGEKKPFQIIYKNKPWNATKLWVSFAEKNFEELFKNIIGNAERHGFTEKGKKYKIEVSLYYDESTEKVRVTFDNNGNPFSEGAIERYHIEGESVGITGNTGIGGSEVTQIAENFGGHINVSNLNPKSDSHYKVRVELILDTINNDNG